jgi:hypothetical protein
VRLKSKASIEIRGTGVSPRHQQFDRVDPARPAKFFGLRKSRSTYPLSSVSCFNIEVSKNGLSPTKLYRIQT